MIEMISKTETALDKQDTEKPQESESVRSSCVAPRFEWFFAGEHRDFDSNTATREELLEVIRHLRQDRDWWKDQAMRRGLL